MVDIRALPSAAATLPDLTEHDHLVLRYVADGLSPRAIAARVDISEHEIYRLVARVLEQLEPATQSETGGDGDAAQGSSAATAIELEEFEQRFGSSLPADEER